MGWTRDSNGGMSDAETPDVRGAPGWQKKPPKLRYKDTVKANLHWRHIKPGDLEGHVMDRPKWRGLVHKAAANLEEAGRQKLTAARERDRRAASTVIKTDSQCPYCSRLYASRLGLQSRLRVHRWDAERKRHHRIQWTTAIYIYKLLRSIWTNTNSI